MQKLDAKDLEAEVAGLGTQIVACTGREKTSYSATVLGKDLGKSVDIFADILLNAKLDEADIAATKDAVLHELGMVNIFEANKSC
jgi:predicted Zn-dependent peptidase